MVEYYGLVWLYVARIGYDNMPYNNDPEKRSAYMREYRRRRKDGGLGGLGAMRRRGRKPIDIKLLTVWEFEWYKALHLLRDRTQLQRDPVAVHVNRTLAQEELEWWKRASLKEILGEMQPGTPPPFGELPESERAKAKVRWEMREWRALKEFAELERKANIASLEQQLKPAKIHALAERRKVWDALIGARTPTVLEEACEEWKRLVDVRALGFSCFPDHILTHATEFLRMKRNRRFPHSSYTAESRLEYLARGMAGVMVGVSPMTAIERLRNMKHTMGGPLWDEGEKQCGCWRCGLQRWRAYYQTLKRILEKGETTT